METHIAGSPIKRFRCVSIIAAFALAALPTFARQRKADCSKPPEWIHSKTQPKTDKQKKSDAHIRGNVLIDVSEDGKVVYAKAQVPAQGDAAAQLESFARSLNFKPRPGCGDFKTQLHVDIGGR